MILLGAGFMLGPCRIGRMALALWVVALLGVSEASQMCLRLGPCSEASAKWSWNQQTHAVTANNGDDNDRDNERCLTATGVHTTQRLGELVLQPCNASDPNQRWTSSQGTVELVDSPGLGWVSEQDTHTGELVWLYDLRPGGPSKNVYCQQQKNCAFTWDGSTFKNPAGNCVVLGSAAPPPPPPPPPPGPSMPTCAAGSPVEHERFCDASLSFEDRAEALVSNLTLDEKLDLWTVNTMARSITRLNIKGFMWDSTCIHGGPFVGATVGPHAINQGATFDTLLVEAMSNATADEMRANSVRTMQQSRGQGPINSLSCDGGPLANSAHDPRWGRIAETYGEDPYLITRMAVTANRAMQQPVQDARGRIFLKTSQTTRHYMGYHQSNEMPNPAINVTERDLRDQFLPAYEAMQVDGIAWNGLPGGRAEAIMCGYAAFDGIPSCANKRLLQDILRKEWGSECLVQSDCCDSISSIFSQHHYTNTEAEAVAAAFEAGTQLCFACGAAQIAALNQSIADNSVTMGQLDSALARLFLTRMRLGEFERGETPHSAANTSVINSPLHQDLVRQVAGASVIMAVNRNKTLPILSPLPTRSIAVVGPFADCGLCYLHSYNGQPSHIAGYVEAVQSMANLTGAVMKTSSKSCSSQDGCAVDNIADAAKLAEDADLVIAVVGLGNTEQEGGDRLDLTLPGCPGRGSCPGGASDNQNTLLKAVRAAMTKPHQKLVLVLVSGGPVALTNISEYDAVLYAGLGGQAAGYGVADVLWGARSPSGRFPVTVYEADYLKKVGPILDYSSTSGVGRTYRYLDTQKSPPIFKFGFGLSYSHFTYSDLVVSSKSSDAGSIYAASPSVIVNVTVKNDAPIGSPSWGGGATEIPQLYVIVPRQPAPLPVPKLALQGFTKVQLRAQESASLSFVLVPRQYCTTRDDGQCEVFSGEYQVAVGGHQPGDELGEATSNVVTGSFKISEAEAHVVPRPDRG